MFLNDFFKNAPIIPINQLSCDSRVPMKDCIYFCIRGIKYNGHNFVDEAISNGANVIVYSEDIDINKNAIFVKVNNVNDVLIQVSNKFYDYPCKKLETYLVSGTYGRSSVTSIINHVLSKTKKCASIGVFGINFNNNNLLINQPTLTVLENQKYFQQFVNEGCQTCTLEASAMSLSYNKMDMVKPNSFIYTYTSPDSSDYKELGLEYVNTLKKYLYSLDNNTVVVLNRDDMSFDELYKAATDKKVSYGRNEDANYIISDIKTYNNLTSFSLTYDKKYIINTKLLGISNVYNLVAAIAALNQNGYPMEFIIDSINDLDCIDGVVERINFDDFNIYVDCAYTYDSHVKILKFAKSITDKNKRLITIVSVNTNDSIERIKNVVSVVDQSSNLTILTADDTYEDDIFEYFEIASKEISKNNYLVIEDREEAIEEAIELLNKGDTLLILGKGNENYMYQGLVKKNYYGDKNNAYKYMNKRLREENSII